MSSFHAVVRDLKGQADPVGAVNRARFFKTGKGQYGENDRFFGLTVPVQRQIAKVHRDLPLKDLDQLLHSPYHEARFVALAILVGQFGRASGVDKQALVDFYLSRLGQVNNWDLVDASAPYIVGQHLLNKRLLHRQLAGQQLAAGQETLLVRLAQSDHLWTRRVAIVSTLTLVKAGEIELTLRIAEMLLEDRHDLIHKAVGWALREVGLVNRSELTGFLARHYQRLPRTTLRYAIEHLSPEARRAALSGSF